MTVFSVFNLLHPQIQGLLKALYRNSSTKFKNFPPWGRTIYLKKNGGDREEKTTSAADQSLVIY